MGLFHNHEEPPPNPSKRCKFLKGALASCHTFCRKISSHEEEDDDDVSDFDDEQEVFVSAVISQYKESKSKRNVGLTVDSFIWGFDSSSGFSPIEKKHAHESDHDEERDEFYSPCSRLSRSSSATTLTAETTFVSVKTNLSRCSSMSSIEVPISRRRRRELCVIMELCHCEGWPFGLCRKALLVPPLPKSPSESWMWRKTTRLVKIP